MATIHLSEEQAAALQARAQAEGLTLEAWLSRVAAGTVGRSKYSLEELLAQCDPAAPLSAEDRVWLDLPATGREL